MSEDGYVKWLEQQLQTAKEDYKTMEQCLRNQILTHIENRNDAVSKNITLAQQNKQMRENINNIKNLCNEDWEDMTVDKFQNQLLQAIKGVE